MPRIDYDLNIQYRLLPGTDRVRPCVAVVIRGPRDQVEVVAQVDSGSRYVVIDGQLAGPIGLDLATGERVELSAARGRVGAYLHGVTLEVEGYEFQCRVAFTDDSIPRPVLGREGFFDFWQVGFRERLSELYLSPDSGAAIRQILLPEAQLR